MITMSGKAIRRWWALFALPTFAAFVIGFLVPFAMGVYLSFCKFSTVTDATFVGVSNYQNTITDPEFLHALVYTILFTIVTTVVINVVAFAIAYMLTKAIKGSTLFRSVFFMPNLIGGIILGYIWLLLLNGVLAHWGRSITFSGVYGFWGMVLLTCWQQIGYMMIIYIAGLQGLPGDVIEAAAVDGGLAAGGFLAAGKHYQQILAQTAELGGDKISRPLPQCSHDQYRGDTQADRQYQQHSATPMTGQRVPGKPDAIQPEHHAVGPASEGDSIDSVPPVAAV